MADNDYSAFIQTLPDIVPNIGIHPCDFIFDNFTLIDGVIVECGVYSGGSITKLANRYPSTKVYGFDSFEGLPESWGRPDLVYDKGAFNLNNRLPIVPSNVNLIAGWFDKTLPEFRETILGTTPIALLHIDCDLYSSTKTTFDCLSANIHPGTIILFDELFNYPTYEKHELLAFYQFINRTKMTYKWIGKNGAVDILATHDNGYVDQPAAVIIC